MKQTYKVQITITTLSHHHCQHVSDFSIVGYAMLQILSARHDSNPYGIYCPIKYKIFMSKNNH